MLSITCSVLLTLLMFRKSHGDSVTQTAGLVTLVEGAPMILNCTYQTIYSVFTLWYVQYLDKAPQLLLKSATENQKTESRGFHATLVKKENSFHLQKPAVQPSDSAVYYCALRDTVRGTAGGAEHKPTGAQEGLGREGYFLFLGSV
uniref:Ig-like domain-containing protein n=1 Tax=Spermophilus dauricus TaxID=99837 RepID=A0A8C9PVV0_SPEDA